MGHHVCKDTKKLVKNLMKRNLIRPVDMSGEQWKLFPHDSTLPFRTVHMAKGKSYNPTLAWAKKVLGYQGK